MPRSYSLACLFRLALACNLAILAGGSVAQEASPQGPPTPPDYAKCQRAIPGSPVTEPGAYPLRIGVRRDARPFSYYSDEMREVWSSAPPAPLAQRKYTGYINKICDAVLADMLLAPPPGTDYSRSPQSTHNANQRFSANDIEVHDIDCLMTEARQFEERQLAAGIEPPSPVKSRFEFLGQNLDLLCDPATITNARRHGFIMSPPLFLTGIGMINLAGRSPGVEDCPGKPLIGHVGNTTAGYAGLLAVLNAQELQSYRDSIISYVSGNNDVCKATYRSTSAGDSYSFIASYPDHTSAAQAFCFGRFHFYLGDREIIVANARKITGCEFEGAGRTFSDDRYAIFGKIDYANPIRALRTARFFEILSQKVVVSDSVLDAAFRTSFIGTEPSPKLQSFFWNIRGPQ